MIFDAKEEIKISSLQRKINSLQIKKTCLGTIASCFVFQKKDLIGEIMLLFLTVLAYFRLYCYLNRAKKIIR